MYRFKTRLCVWVIIMILLLGNVGCVKMVEGYKKFHIHGFEDFFNIKKLENQKEYIDSGKLDIYETEGIIIIPFIKEISEIECAILLFPFSQNTKTKVILNEVSLVTAEGEVLSFTEKFGEIEVFSLWNDSMILVNTFNKSDAWFFNGNKLTLIINVTIEKEDDLVETEITYDVNIIGYKGTAVQV